MDDPPEASIDPKSQPTYNLLRRAHSPASAARIHAEKIQHRPLLLAPSTPTPPSEDARAARRRYRETQRLRRSTKPKPLSAREKRKLCVYDIPKEEIRWELYAGLNRLWQAYIRDILGTATRKTPITAAADGMKLATADFHGAEVEVVQSACAGRVGTRGVVVRDTKFTFMIVTRGDKLRTVPKEGTVFRVCVDTVPEELKDDPANQGKGIVMVEMHGDQLRNRPPERANRKHKPHYTLAV